MNDGSQRNPDRRCGVSSLRFIRLVIVLTTLAGCRLLPVKAAGFLLLITVETI